MLDPTAASELTYGVTKAGSLTNGQGQVFRLQANAGERLYFDNLSTNPSNSNGVTWKLLNASDSQVVGSFRIIQFLTRL